MKIVVSPFVFISYCWTFVAGGLFAAAFPDKNGGTFPKYLWPVLIVAAIVVFWVSIERERRFTGFDNIRWPPGGVGYDQKNL